MKTIQIIMTLIMIGLISFSCKSTQESAISKQAKEIRKAGFYIEIGALPMEFQLERSHKFEQDVDSSGKPKYIVTSGRALANTHIAAKMQALAAAKNNIAGLLASDIAGLVESSVSNNQLSRMEAQSITKTLSANTNIIAQKLGKVMPLMVTYHDVGDNVEASVRIAVNKNQADVGAKKAAFKKLQEDTEVTKNKLSRLLGLE